MGSGILKTKWPYIALILAHSIWGVNFIIVKLALVEFPPMSLAFFRFLIATILLIPFIIISDEAPWTNIRRVLPFIPNLKMLKKTSTDNLEGKTAKYIDKKDLFRIILVAVFMVGLNIALFFLGMEKTNVISASVLTLIIPITSVIVGWTILREKIYVVNFFGVLAGLLGAIAVLGLPLVPINAGFPVGMTIGNILIILSSLSWVAGAVLSKKLLKKYSTLTLTFMVFAIGTLIFLIPTLNEYFRDPSWISRISFLGIFTLLYTAIASSIAAYFLFQWGMDQVGVAKADLFQFLEPLIAITLGVLVLGDQLRFSFIIGVVLIILGVYWSTLGKDSLRHPKYHRH